MSELCDEDIRAINGVIVRARNDAIEECARIADGYSKFFGDNVDIAAAIRAIGDNVDIAAAIRAMSVLEGHVSVDLLQVLREQDDILANEAANEIERLRQGRNAIIEECARMAADVIAEHRCCTDLADKIAAAIRALKSA